MRKLLRLLLHRVAIVAYLLIIQIVLLVSMIWRFYDYFAIFYAICILISVLAVMAILYGRDNPAYKIAWLVPILLFPIAGGILYLIFGGTHSGGRLKRKMRLIAQKMALAHRDEAVLEEIREQDLNAYNQSRYIYSCADCPPYRGTYTKYLPLGEVKYRHLLEALEKAERYIFLEYFIIKPGVMWDTILEVLVRKAAQGVDVRVMYDDMGCILTLPYQYDKTLEALGVKCAVFNPFVPILSSRFNNRDHRKIAVIDGHTGFTGGINLADEYINEKEVHGHWKDTAILLKGEAVWSLVVMFLSTWDYARGEDEDFADYRPAALPEECYSRASGYVQPFSDSPLDDEFTGENIYLNLINRAQRYVYINTPYLIIDNEMVTALCLAAKSGVDVRIVTPHVADKWYVHTVTQSYYSILLESGVAIYEYTPGFMHAKTFVVDDMYGVVGTINLDYRSLYLHFECGVWLFGTGSLLELKEDYLETLARCTPVTLEDCRVRPLYKRLLQLVLRAFAPLM